MGANGSARLERLPAGGLVCVVGARPNFMKVAPILRALAVADPPFPVSLVHTGQHYGPDMQEAFFHQLGLPQPDIDLEVGSASHAAQTGEIMTRFEEVVDAVAPEAVLVVGDVNSTLACSLVAAKKGVAVTHVEAGLRSGDRAMPEEINRVLTDQLATLHFTTETGARDHLLREGIDPDGIHFVGNVMIDSLLHHRDTAVAAGETLERYLPPEATEIPTEGFALVTLHRPSNVDDPEVLRELVETLEQVSERLPLVFPVHPRTRGALEAVGWPRGRRHPVMVLPPVGYLEMLGLMAGSRLVLTDSGGMQEETTALGIPCITLRENTERPVTLEQGTNTLTGTDRRRILETVDDVLATGGKGGRVPELWDGRAGERIADVLADWAPLTPW
ncbi:non-hydrolyzing UDP-N-acetylglucosamine 2-epimerase [Thiohalorhabdus sp.]|uniref:non-hydrolyzing UDP-N-acetylglucosamine 2-epimerase n=1 Tax=Thiohalorhabdus sp. TaxID=3094134 RepID=UPI002FC34436